MVLNFAQISALLSGLNALQEQKLPFKLSLALAKNIAALKKEEEFFIEQERNFAQKYLEFDSETGELVQESPNVFRIKSGLEQECREARKDLDSFTADVPLRKIEIDVLEKLELTPKQVGDLALLIDDGEEEDNKEE